MTAPGTSSTTAGETTPRVIVGDAVTKLPRMPRSFVVASLIGALAGFAIVAFIMVATQVGPATRHYSDDFFDAQARSWLAGTWSVPASSVGGEGFATDKGTQIYFGIMPSLLRLPVLAVSNLDGKLTVPSELLALAVLLIAASRLAWTSWSLLATGSDPPPESKGWYPPTVVGLFVALIGACSTAPFLAAQPTVFSEAILWSAALAVASFDQLARLLLAPTTTRALLTAALAGAAFNTRVTTGLGAMAPLVVVAVVALLPRGSAWRRRGRSLVPDADGLRRCAVPLLVIVGVSIAICFGANTARFDHPWKIPYEKQVVYRFDPDRLATFQASSGPFSTGYLPTDVVLYLRPDGLRITPFPIVTYPDPRDTIVGNVPPNIVEPAASVPSSATGLFLLAVAGAAAMFGRRHRGRLVALRLAVLGAAVPAFAILNFASLAHRYTGDFLPILVVLGGVGAARAARTGAGRERTIIAGGLLLLTIWGAWVTVGLTMFTNEHNSIRNRPALESWVGGLADLQARLGRGVVAPQPARPPTDGAGWDLIARPDCARVYTSYFNGWYAFERTPGTGAFHVHVTPPPDDGLTHAITRSHDGRYLVGLRSAGGAVNLAFSRDGGATFTRASTIRGYRGDGTTVPTALAIGDDGRIDLVIDHDPFLGTVTASGNTNDTFLLVNERVDQQESTDRPGPPASLAADYPGAVTEIADPPPQCSRWTTGH